MTDSALIYEKVGAVLADMPAIGKDRQAPGSMGGYSFRGIEDITAALKPLLAKHGVVMVPVVLERVDSSRTVGARNSTMFVVDLRVRFTFYAQDGSSFAAEMWGEGTDMGDKATQKAVTSAFKSMLSVTFCISDSSFDAEAHDVPETMQRGSGVQTGGAVHPASPSDVTVERGLSAPVASAPDSSGLSESTGKAGASVLPDDAPATISKARREKLKSRLVALQADGVLVADEREALGLPLVDSCTAEQLAEFEELADHLEADLEAPFEAAKS